ncbi:MAG: (d)CMP kinase [Calditrichae bacterium]|nr:(d)CMP kinase [Calditrichia bacterium]
MNKITIAIDGPAASGKSTTAREVARRLGYTYIDSGAMYRAVTLKALRENISVDNGEKIAGMSKQLELQFGRNDSKTVIYMDGEDISEKIRTPQIDQNISPVAANPAVRLIMVQKQRAIGKEGGIVMDGRDIGTVVFPNADLKIFMQATVQERALRRKKEQEQKGIKINLDKVVSDIEYRDQQDSTRNHGPLLKAEDAVEIDTTRLTVEQQIGKILELAKLKIQGR